MNWEKSIILAFVLFTAFIVTLVTVCVRQDISLVSSDYYQQELAYGAQIQRMENAGNLATRPEIQREGDSLIVAYADFQKVTSGELILFRPSDAQFDRTFNVVTGDATNRSFSVSGMPPGMYKAKLRWQMDDKEYFVEEIINL